MYSLPVISYLIFFLGNEYVLAGSSSSRSYDVLRSFLRDIEGNTKCTEECMTKYGKNRSEKFCKGEICCGDNICPGEKESAKMHFCGKKDIEEDLSEYDEYFDGNKMCQGTKKSLPEIVHEACGPKGKGSNGDDDHNQEDNNNVVGSRNREGGNQGPGKSGYKNHDNHNGVNPQESFRGTGNGGNWNPGNIGGENPDFNHGNAARENKNLGESPNLRHGEMFNNRDERKRGEANDHSIRLANMANGIEDHSNPKVPGFPGENDTPEVYLKHNKAGGPDAYDSEDQEHESFDFESAMRKRNSGSQNNMKAQAKKCWELLSEAERENMKVRPNEIPERARKCMKAIPGFKQVQECYNSVSEADRKKMNNQQGFMPERLKQCLKAIPGMKEQMNEAETSGEEVSKVTKNPDNAEEETNLDEDFDICKPKKATCQLTAMNDKCPDAKALIDKLVGVLTPALKKGGEVEKCLPKLQDTMDDAKHAGNENTESGSERLKKHPFYFLITMYLVMWV